MSDPVAEPFTAVTETVMMPAEFQNALKGDVILSPGGTSTISQLFRAMTPPQYHAHSGIMSKNFIEITHCKRSGRCPTAAVPNRTIETIRYKESRFSGPGRGKLRRHFSGRRALREPTLQRTCTTDTRRPVCCSAQQSFSPLAYAHGDRRSSHAT